MGRYSWHIVTRPGRAATVLGAGALVATVLAACAGTTGSGGVTAPAGPGDTSGTPAGQVTVLAAASLQQAFTAIGREFEAANPGTTVVFSFGASSALAQQVTAGAPADVFAAASTATMQQVVDTGAAGNPTVFATNSMQIAVPPADPGGVTSLADLADPDVTVALCQEQVPCGATALTVLGNAGMTITPVTLEPDVKAVLSKVTLGEVDAGIVYVTDVIAAGDAVRGIAIPADVNASTAYPIATLTGSGNPTAARAFVAHVLSPQGQQVLARNGFGAPPP